MKRKGLNFLWMFLAVSFCFGLSKSIAAEKEIGGIKLEETQADMVKVTKRKWAYVGGGKRHPVVSFVLNSGRMIYEIRHDPGRIGLSQPTPANWYRSGMLRLFLNGKQFPLLPANNEKVDIESGKKGKVALSWENETARVNYNFVLFAGDDKLFMEIKLEPKVEIKDIRITLTNYVSGFNFKPEHILYTSSQKFVGKGWNKIDPQKENYILYTDKTLDPANNPKAMGPSAVLFSNDGLKSVGTLQGGYGIRTDLIYKSTTRRMVFCFWEFPKKPNSEALEYFKTSVPKAKKIMKEPKIFYRENDNEF